MLFKNTTKIRVHLYLLFISYLHLIKQQFLPNSCLVQVFLNRISVKYLKVSLV